MLIKGPIIYAFILPGLIVYQIPAAARVARRAAGAAGGRGFFPSPSFSPGRSAGSLGSRAFMRAWWCENLPGVSPRRSTSRSRSIFICPHLLHKFAPWSLLLIGLTVFFWRRRERLSLQMEPETVWLVCWSVGGLLLMSIIPSKRVDRIFPIVPPLCLLLGAQVARALDHERWRAQGAAVARAFAHFCGRFHGRLRGLEDRRRRGTSGVARWYISRGRCDGRRPRGTGVMPWSAGGRRGCCSICGGIIFSPRRRDRAVESGRLDALVVRNQPARAWLELLPGAKLRRVSEKAEGLPQYSLFVRA